MGSNRCSGSGLSLQRVKFLLEFCSFGGMVEFCFGGQCQRGASVLVLVFLRLRRNKVSLELSRTAEFQALKQS